jgi:hypothetical protein
MTIAVHSTGRRERQAEAQRLGYRNYEWSEMTGTSRQTTWRAIRSGALKTVSYCGITLVPDSERIRLGFADQPIT